MRRLTIFLTLTVGLSTVSAASAEAPATGHRWAVLIGIDDYLHARDLKYCGADQRSLRSQLLLAGFPDRQVTLLHDDATDKRLLPFRANIRQQVELVRELAEQGDLVLVAFSGHGVHLGKTSYLCPADAKLEEEETLISLDWVYEQLQKCKADLRLMMVDACRNVPPEFGGKRALSGVEFKESSRAFVKEAERLPDGIMLLSSCSEGEFSQEDEKIGHGVFMHFVLEGLKGKADENKNGQVTLNELFAYASDETKFYVRDKFADSQRPKLKGNLTIEALKYVLGTKAVLPDTLTNSIGQTLKLIPAGEFDMGSPESPDDLLRRFPYAKREWVVGEQPVHHVKITKPFYMGIHEVTLGQFLKFYHDAKYKVDAEKDGKGGWGYDPNNKAKPFEQKANYRPWSWGFEGQTMDHPIVDVSWNDAKAFCIWLSEKERKKYRLPTEAEWEYACRAGTKTRYWKNDDPEELSTVDNLWDSSANNRFRTASWTPQNYLNSSDGYPFSAPVGSFKPNPFGLHDMHGNAAEWCEDWYDEGFYAKSPSEDPTGPSTGSSRVIRGGGWSAASLSTVVPPFAMRIHRRTVTTT